MEITNMSGVKIYKVGVNGVRLSKGMTVQEFKSWIISTLGGSGGDVYNSVIQSNDGGYVAVGYQQSQSQGSNDALIAKLPSDLVVEGVIDNHTGLVWTEPTLVETSPTLTVTTPTLTETSPTLVETSPTLTETSPTLVETRSEKQ